MRTSRHVSQANETLESVLQVTVAAGCALSACVHVALAFGPLHASPPTAVAFASTGIALGIAAVLVARRARWANTMAAALLAAMLVAYAAVHGGAVEAGAAHAHGHAHGHVDPLAAITKAVELAGLVAAAGRTIVARRH
jgi:hypothetical protein